MSRIALFFCLICCLLLTGCWDQREITEQGFAVGLAIDRIGDRYRLTAQVIQPTQGASPASARQAWHLSALGRTPTEAARLLNTRSQREIDLGHIRVILLSDGVARSGIGPVLDFIARSGEIRPTAWMAVVDGEAQELLIAPTGLERIAAMGILGNMGETEEVDSFIPAQRVHAVVRTLGAEGIDLTLPRLQLTPALIGTENKKETEILMAGAAVFRQEELVQWTDRYATRGIQWVRGTVWQTNVTVPCPEGGPDALASFDMRTAESNVTVQPDQAAIQIRVNADLIFHDCPISPNEPKHLVALRDALADGIYREVQRAVELSRETRADILGLGQSLHRRHPALWMQVRAQWPDRLESIPIKVSVRAEVNRFGMARNGKF